MSTEPRTNAVLFERAQRVIPGGVNSPVRAFRASPPHAIYVDRGAGSHVWDVDGNEYIDFVAGLWFVNVGHGRTEIADAVAEQEALALEDEDTEHGELVDALADDVPPHHLGDEVVASADRRPLHHRVVRGLRRQRQGAQGVHDQVHPQQLHYGQGGAS